MADLEFRRQWIEALKSGKYSQARGFIKSNASYCCLGVACKLDGIDLAEHNNSDANLSDWPDVVRKLGLRDVDGIFAHPIKLDENTATAKSFVDANDNAGLTFEQIAELAEKYPKIVFRS